MIHMVSKINKEFPKALQELQGLGFPEKPLHDLQTKEVDVQEQIHHRLWQLFKMAKYEEKAAES